MSRVLRLSSRELVQQRREGCVSDALLGMICSSGKASAGQRAATIDGGGDDDRRSSVELAGKPARSRREPASFLWRTPPTQGTGWLDQADPWWSGDAHSSLTSLHCKEYIVGAKQGTAVVSGA